jgi:murein DD-endopeptidase MepM/ murein hydrolase activator NlpD
VVAFGWIVQRMTSSRRFIVTVTDERSGVTRRVRISLRPVVIAAVVFVSLPVLVGMGAAWKAQSDITALAASQQLLEDENTNYRAATEVLSTQIDSLRASISDLGARSALEPNLARAVDRLPAWIRSRAMGGTEFSVTARQAVSALTGPEDTFGLLRALLESLELRLHIVRLAVERRNALANATPSIWPAQGWLSSTLGPRTNPMTGDASFHSGLDIAAVKGQPVYATADGTVTEAGYHGAYGKSILISHGFGLQTRYGHLLDYSVKLHDRVKRGDVIGHVGATGRATGYHLHYEVMANGQLLNPLRLLTRTPRGR